LISEQKLLFRNLAERNVLFRCYDAAVADPARSPRSGRAAQAARNDRLILESAREVFLADPRAPITAVAERAGVGISALYSRYGSKDELLRQLSRGGLETILEAIEAAAEDDRDPWTVFVSFMERLVDADVAALTLSLAGKFTPTEDMWELAARTNAELSERLFPKIKSALRPGFDAPDVSLILEIVGTIRVGDGERTKQLRRRYLAIILDGLRADRTEPLSGSPPTWDEIGERWDA
jgi:AcrR family transcriptional regulator